jgi:hypothetical protein
VNVIARGVSDIKGVHSLNTQPGPLTESKRHLKLYRLALEKENLTRRLAWSRRRKGQIERRLSEIVFMMQSIEERAKREADSKYASDDRSAFIRY